MFVIKGILDGLAYYYLGNRGEWTEELSEAKVYSKKPNLKNDKVFSTIAEFNKMDKVMILEEIIVEDLNDKLFILKMGKGFFTYVIDVIDHDRKTIFWSRVGKSLKCGNIVSLQKAIQNYTNDYKHSIEGNLPTNEGIFFYIDEVRDREDR